MSMTNPLVLSVLAQASFYDGGCIITQMMLKVDVLDVVKVNVASVRTLPTRGCHSSFAAVMTCAVCFDSAPHITQGMC
jgi:hypothetical protein